MRLILPDIYTSVTKEDSMFFEKMRDERARLDNSLRFLDDDLEVEALKKKYGILNIEHYLRCQDLFANLKGILKGDEKNIFSDIQIEHNTAYIDILCPEAFYISFALFLTSIIEPKIDKKIFSEYFLEHFDSRKIQFSKKQLSHYELAKNYVQKSKFMTVDIQICTYTAFIIFLLLEGGHETFIIEYLKRKNPDLRKNLSSEFTMEDLVKINFSYDKQLGKEPAISAKNNSFFIVEILFCSLLLRGEAPFLYLRHIRQSLKSAYACINEKEEILVKSEINKILNEYEIPDMELDESVYDNIFRLLGLPVNINVLSALEQGGNNEATYKYIKYCQEKGRSVILGQKFQEFRHLYHAFKLLANCYNNSRKYAIESFFSQGTIPEEIEVNDPELIERIKLLETRNRTLYELMEENQKKFNEQIVNETRRIEKKSKELEMLQRKNEELQAVIEMQERSLKVSEDAEKVEDTIEDMLDYLNAYNFCIIGGFPAWVNQCREDFPNYIFLSRDEARRTRFTAQSDAIIFKFDQMSHSQFQKVVNSARTHGVPHYFIDGANREATIKKLYTIAKQVECKE